MNKLDLDFKVWDSAVFDAIYAKWKEILKSEVPTAMF